MSSLVVLDPDLEIVDAHHHLWPESGDVVSTTPGPGQTASAGTRLDHCPAYSLDDLHRDATAGHRVVGSVFMECSAFYRTDGPERLRSVGETETVAQLPRRGGLCDGIVGFADLTLGSDVAEILEAHMAVAGPRFKGVRHSVAWDPDPAVYATFRRPPAGLLSDPRFVAGAKEVAARGLSFDTWLYFHQLPEFGALRSEQPHADDRGRPPGRSCGHWPS